MALAKAFPDTYMYELQEPSSVSPPLMTFTLCAPSAPPDITARTRFSFPSGLRLPLPAAGFRAAVSGAVPPLVAAPQRERGQRRGRALRRGPGGGERPGEHPPALRPAVQKQVGGSQCHQRKRRQRQKLRRVNACTVHAKRYVGSRVFFGGGEEGGDSHVIRALRNIVA